MGFSLSGGLPHGHSIVFRGVSAFRRSSEIESPAILTRSGREPAFIFCITLPWCALTVISLMPSSPPICLFNRWSFSSVRRGNAH